MATVVFVLALGIGFAQTTDTLAVAKPDTVAPPAKPRSPFLSNFLLQLENRGETYEGIDGRMIGLRTGLEFGKRFRTGFGVYGNSRQFDVAYPELSSDRKKTAHLSYGTWFSELVWYRSWRWELASSVSFGSGTLRVTDFKLVGNIASKTGDMLYDDVGIRDLATTAQFKIIPWFGFGLGVGHRSTNVEADKNFNPIYSTFYYDVKAKFFIGYLYKAMFEPKKNLNEKAYYKWRKEQRTKKFKALFK